MSYTGVRKVKVIIDSEGKYNMGCEYYDSSITDWRGNRVWHSTGDKGLYIKGFNTKEELEYAIFKDTLDGNIHGTGGKYSCLGWGSKKVILTNEELNKIKELENRKYSLMYSDEIKKLRKELRDKGIEYKDMESSCPRYKELQDEINKACKEYTDYRYNTWHKAWKKYLEEKKINNRKANKRVYIIRVDWKGYHNIFISSHGSRTTKFTNYFDNAKLFTCSIEELKKEFLEDDYRNNQYTRISAIDVTNHIVGKGKYRHARIDYDNFSTDNITVLRELCKIK